MRKRKPLPMADKIKVLMRQAICTWCGGKLGDGPVEWDHMDYYALGGTDDWYNFQAIHPECHKAKTFGTHVPLSGDISKIAKSKRIQKREASHQEKMRAKLLAPTEKPPCPKSRWPKGRKIPTRPKSTPSARTARSRRS